jgi:hypothetical protein
MRMTETEQPSETYSELLRTTLGAFTIDGVEYTVVALRFGRMQPQLAWLYREGAEIGYLEGLPFGQSRLRLASRSAAWPAENDARAASKIATLWRAAGFPYADAQ